MARLTRRDAEMVREALRRGWTRETEIEEPEDADEGGWPDKGGVLCQTDDGCTWTKSSRYGEILCRNSPPNDDFRKALEARFEPVPNGYTSTVAFWIK
jgi:hypothetical protein